ncbi:MAG: hypothetical protein ABSC38_04235 [Verrucomicrobiia bacterium]
MNKNIWIVVLLVVVAVLAAVVVSQNLQIARMEEQPRIAVAVNRNKVPPKPTLARKAPVPLPEASMPENVEAQAPVPTTDAPTNTSTGTTSNFFAGLSGMMKNPQMKEMVRAQQKMVIDQTYASLSKYLNLSADQLDALKNLLLERQMAMVDSGLAAMSGSESERKQAVEDTKAIKAEYDQKIKDLLSPQDYQTFQDYEKTASERVQIQMFKGTLPADAALTDQQENDLITAMYEARKDLPSSSLLNNRNSDPSQLTEERIAETMKQMEQLQQVYADRAKGILTPSQYEQFIQWQQQMSAMQAAAMKMAQQMFGNKGAVQPPVANPNQAR